MAQKIIFGPHKSGNNSSLDRIFDAIKNNDVDAFERLYMEHYENLCRYLFNYVSERNKVEDVVQETFIAFWSKRHQINIHGSVKSYLYRSAYNRVMDLHREKKKTDKLLDTYYHTALIQAESLAEAQKEERMNALESCIEQLPDKCKRVFIANKIEGKKYQEVAEEFDLSLKTVEGHIGRAYKLIRDCVGAKG